MTTSRRALFRAGAGLAAAAAAPPAPRVHLPVAMGLAGPGSLAASQARGAGIHDGYKALACLYVAGATTATTGCCTPMSTTVPAMPRHA